MSVFVESLKRLYERQRVSLEKLEALQASGKLTAEEAAYITKKETR